jgi:hypothetical protein
MGKLQQDTPELGAFSSLTLKTRSTREFKILLVICQDIILLAKFQLMLVHAPIESSEICLWGR